MHLNFAGLCEENDIKTEKLTNTITELQQLLKSASEQYGELETKHKNMLLQHEEEISQKCECIKLLKKELEDANELLKLAKEGRVLKQKPNSFRKDLNSLKLIHFIFESNFRKFGNRHCESFALCCSGQ